METYTGGSADSRSLQTAGRNVQASLGSTRRAQLGTAPCTSRVSTHCSSANTNLPSVNDGICLACNNLLTNQFSTASCGDRFELRLGGQQLASVRILIVDDFKPWRCALSSMLREHLDLEIVGEASDGLEAVQKTGQLLPDLILLDIGLPKLNGIEAARQICEIVPTPTILFVSENRCRDVVEEALRTCARGYVLKSNVARDLLTAVRAVIADKLFVSNGLASHSSTKTTDV